MNPKPHFIVDMDDTLYNTEPMFWEWYKRISGKEEKNKSIYGWSMSEYIGRPDVMRDIFSDPQFFLDLEPKSGARELMTYLFSRGIVTIATAGVAEIHEAKEEALKRDFDGLYDNVSFSWEKNIYRGDIFIDDRPKYISGFSIANPEGLAIVIDHPFNRNIGAKHARVTDLRYAIEIIEKFLQEKGY